MIEDDLDEVRMAMRLTIQCAIVRYTRRSRVGGQSPIWRRRGGCEILLADVSPRFLLLGATGLASRLMGGRPLTYEPL